ncbi:MAG: hypothetical protein IT379_04350 [Deltaproteobacteria bacterium]|nr:hypothetical protein [Deltaproteobacteria bacterium]
MPCICHRPDPLPRQGRGGLKAIALVALLVGCSSDPTDQTPEGAVELFLTAMRETAADPSAQARAYRLLARPARRALYARARRAGELAGRDFAPEAMLVAGRLRLRFRPGVRMRAEVNGTSGVVVLTGQDGRVARVPVVREEAGWRIVLDVPPIPAPADRRRDAGR